MLYELIEWPDIQYFMDRIDYKEKVYYDSNKGVWFVPEEWMEK